MELNYVPQVDSQSGRLTGFEKPMLLFRYPLFTPGTIAIMLVAVTFVAMLGVVINVSIQESKYGGTRKVVYEKRV